MGMARQFAWTEENITKQVEDKKLEEAWLVQREAECKNMIAGINAKIERGVATEADRIELESYYGLEKELLGKMLAEREAFKNAHPRIYGIHAVVARNIELEKDAVATEVARWKRVAKANELAKQTAGAKVERNPFARIPMKPRSLWTTKANREDKQKFKEDL